jgi:hypothetical protein
MMNKQELAKRLKEEGIPEDRYSLDDGLPSGRLCLGKTASDWDCEVY